MVEVGSEKRGRGRPRVHQSDEERLAAGAKAAREYRARKKKVRDERRDQTVPLSSAIIDLSVLPAWRRK